MTFRRIIFRGLVHHWRTNLCVVGGLAVATAVITGSLMVGDSITGSLRRLALARIGSIDYAVASTSFFRARLADELSASTQLGSRADHISAAIVSSGVARLADAEAGSVRVNICGVDEAFWAMFPDSPRPQLTGRAVAVSRLLADDLGVKTGDELMLLLQRPSLIPGSSVFAKRKRDQTMRSIRVEVGAILPQQGPGGFNLQPGSLSPRNVFIGRDMLARMLEKPDGANLLLVAGRDQAGIQRSLDQLCALTDYGLRLNVSSNGGCVSLESDGVLLTPAQIAAVERAASSVSGAVSSASVYLATRIASTSDPNRGVSYSMVAAIDPTPAFTFSNGGGDVGDDGIWINAWAAQDLGVSVGDPIELNYLVSQPDGTYREVPIRLNVRGIVEISGPAADATLTPGLAGVTDAERIDRWNAPFPVDMNRVTRRDEEYWDRYRAVPKSFVSMSTMRRIWAGGSSLQPPFVTSVRIAPPAEAGQSEGSFS